MTKYCRRVTVFLYDESSAVPPLFVRVSRFLHTLFRGNDEELVVSPDFFTRSKAGMLLLFLVGKARYAAPRVGAYETTLTDVGKFLWGDGWRPGRHLETLRGLVQWLECHPLQWGGRLYRVVLVARLPRRQDEPFTVWIDCPPGETAGPLVDAAFLSSVAGEGGCHARFLVNLALFWNAAEKVAFARGEKNKKTERFIFATDALGNPSPHVRRVRRLSIDEIAAAMFVGDAPTPAARRKRRQRASECAGGHAPVPRPSR